MIAGVFFDGRNTRLHQVQIGLNDGMITVTGGGIVRAYPYADARMDEPYAHAPCVLDFIDGARCEVDDPEGKGLLALVLGHDLSDAERLREHWYDVLIAVGLLAVCVLALLWQG